MEVNHFCEEENCLAPAQFFYFKGGNQRKVCTSHQFPAPEKLYSIDRVSFITSPEAETQYLNRLEEVKKSREYLRQVKLKVDEEVETAIEALEAANRRAVQVINEVYEAEKRRTMQHFHQVEVILADLNWEISMYITTQTSPLSPLLQKTLTETKVPSILRVRVFNLDLELAKAVLKSSTRGELPLDKHMTMLLSPVTRNIIANQLFQQAKKSLGTTDFIELQKALADSEEALSLKIWDEAEKLRDALKEIVERKNWEREREMIEIQSQDTASIKTLLQLHLAAAENEKIDKNVQEVEKLYRKIRQLALPHSQSRETAEALMQAADWYYHQGSQLDMEAEEIWKDSLHIYSLNFPTSLEIATNFKNLGGLYARMNRSVEAEESLNTALHLLEVHFPMSFETARTFCCLGDLCNKTNRYAEAVEHWKAALQIFTPHFPTSIETAKTFCNLGVLYLSKLQYPDAENSFQSALTILTANFPTALETAQTYYNLGGLYQNLGRTNAAEQSFQGAIKLLLVHFPISIDTAKSLSGLGYVYASLGRYQEAEQNWLEALKVFTPYFPTSSETAMTWMNLAEYCLKEALKIYQANRDVGMTDKITQTLMSLYESTDDFEKMEELIALRN